MTSKVTKYALSLLLLLLTPCITHGQTLVRPVFIGNSTSSVGGPAPNTIMTETDAPANSRRWLWLLQNQVLNAQITNDNGSSPINWATITRSGNSITSVWFPTLSTPLLNLTGSLSLTAGGYFNWGATIGTSGYGVRDNAGTMEFKNSAGQWLPMANTAASAGGWTKTGGVVSTTTGTDVVTAGNINNVRFCNQFSGADAGAQIAACIADLPTTGGTADARGLQGAQTSASNPFAGVTKPVTLLLGDITLSIATAPSLAANKLGIIGIPGRSVMKYTGTSTTNFVTLDGTGGANGYSFVLDGVRIDANGLANDGLFMNKAVSSVVRNVSVTNAITTGLLCQSCVLNSFYDYSVSSNLAAFTTRPVNGIKMILGGALGSNSTNNFYNANIAGVSGAGILLISSFNGSFHGGSSEGNGSYGIQMNGANPLDVSNNSFISFDLESNTTCDLDMPAAQENAFLGITSGHATCSARVGALSGVNNFVGGNYTAGPSVLTGGAYNKFNGLQVDSAITDSGTNTVIQAVFNGVLAAFQTNQMPILTYGQTPNQILQLDNSLGSYLGYEQGGHNGFLGVGGAARVLATGLVQIDANSNGVALGKNTDTAGPGSATVLLQDQTATTGATKAVVKAGAGDTSTSVLLSLQSAAGSAITSFYANGGIMQSGTAFASLPSIGPGYFTYISDGQVTSVSDNTCKAGGTGAFGVRLNGVWRCFAFQN